MRWLEPALWHVTMRFLGAWPQEGLASLRDECARCAALSPSRIMLRLEALGAFPNAGAARVAWVGAHEPTGHLARLAAELEAAAVALGAEPEVRPFRAHLTVARIKSPADLRGLLSQPAWQAIETAIDELLLYESHTLPSGSRYEVLGRWRLGP